MFICTAENVWTPEIKGQVVHPDAVDIGEENDGIDEYDLYECPHCGKVFVETVG